MLGGGRGGRQRLSLSELSVSPGHRGASGNFCGRDRAPSVQGVHRQRPPPPHPHEGHPDLDSFCSQVNHDTGVWKS